MAEFWAWLGITLASMAGGVGILWTVGGYYHIKYYVRRAHEPETWKCQPKRFLRPEQARHAMKLSTLNLLLGGFLSGNLVYALTRGWDTPIYFDVAQYGWAWTAASAVLYFIAVDFLAYWTHRALHFRPMFKAFHHWHHRYVATTPFVVTAMHPVEFLMFQTVSFLPLFLFPIHYLAVIVTLIYALVWNTIDHSGVRLESRIPFQGPSIFHDDHHAHFHVNFGQHMGVWDRLFGTLRREGRRYGVDVFGGKGAADGAGAPAPYVKY